MPHRSSARLLAPLALAVAALAFLLVIGGSGSDSKSSSTSATSTTAKRAKRAGGAKSGSVARANPRKAPAGRRTYVVQNGDTLSKIATRTQVPLATLQELNPNVDPQGLHAGQKLRIK